MPPAPGINSLILHNFSCLVTNDGHWWFCMDFLSPECTRFLLHPWWIVVPRISVRWTSRRKLLVRFTMADSCQNSIKVLSEWCTWFIELICAYNNTPNNCGVHWFLKNARRSVQLRIDIRPIRLVNSCLNGFSRRTHLSWNTILCSSVGNPT